MAKIRMQRFEEPTCDVHPDGGAACKGSIGWAVWVEEVPVMVKDENGNDVQEKDGKGNPVVDYQVFKGEACEGTRNNLAKATSGLSALAIAVNVKDDDWTEGKRPVRSGANKKKSGGKGASPARKEWEAEARRLLKSDAEAIRILGRPVGDAGLFPSKLVERATVLLGRPRPTDDE